MDVNGLRYKGQISLSVVDIRSYRIDLGVWMGV